MKKVFLCLLLVLAIGTSFAQLKFYTNGGKTEIKQAKCGIRDLQVKVPIPETVNNYDKLRFYLFLTPKRESGSQLIYECHFEKEVFNGKKELMITLKSEDGSNDFYSGRYGMNWGYAMGDPSALNIDKPCNNPERIDQIYLISFELEGMKFQKMDYLSEGNSGKQPIYQTVLLKKWPNAFPIDYGIVDINSMSSDKSFSIRKTYDIPVEIRHDNDETVISVSSAILGSIRSFPATQHSIEELKADLILGIKKTTLYNYEDPKLRWNIELCYPCYAKKVKKGSHAELNDKLKEICASPADWKPAIVGGMDGFILDIPQTLDSQNWSAEDSKPRVAEGDEIPWRRLMAFVVESKGKIVIGVVEYRRGNESGSPMVANFFNDLVSSIKVY